MLSRCQKIIGRNLTRLIGNKRNILLAPKGVNFLNDVWDASYLAKSLEILKDSSYSAETDVIGSSANAVVALLYGIGYNIREIQAKINELSFYKILRNGVNKCNRPLSIIVDSNTNDDGIEGNLNKQFKMSERDNFVLWVQKQINNKLGDPMATFNDLHLQAKHQARFKNVHLLGLNIETGKFEIFNYKNTPDMPITIAARICMSFLTVFSVVEINDLTLNKKYSYMDGGIALQHVDFAKYKIAS